MPSFAIALAVLFFLLAVMMAIIAVRSRRRKQDLDAVLAGCCSAGLCACALFMLVIGAAA